MSEKISDETMKQLEFLSEVTHKRWYELGQSDSFAIAEAVKVLRALRDPKWKLVPVEPTEAMIDCGATAWEQNNHGSPYDDEISSIYRAMLQAAPSVTIEGEKE